MAKKSSGKNRVGSLLIVLLFAVLIGGGFTYNYLSKRLVLSKP